jgi:hypothetical protein
MTAYRVPAGPPLPPPPLPFKPQLVLWGIVAAVTGLASLGWLEERALLDEHARLVPWVLDALDGVPAIAFLGTTVALIVVLARAIPKLRARRLRVRVASVLGSLVLHAAMGFATFSLLLTANPEWLFGPENGGSATHEGRTAYYLREGFLGCRYSLYVAPRYSLVMRQVWSAPVDCAALDRAKLRWNDAGEPELVGEDGAPLPPGKSLGDAFAQGC